MSELFGTAVVIFFAELGDKTQLVALGFGARHRFGPVLAGVVLAYAVTNAISVAVGGAAGAALPTEVVGLLGGALFLLFAVLTWLGGNTDREDSETSVPRPGTFLRVTLSVAAAMFVAELGDKTMLATATLASRGSPIMVWAGATLGICGSGGLGVALGRYGGSRLPARTVRLVSAALFALFGLGMIVSSL